MKEIKNEKIILGLMGTIGSGKTYFSDYLINNYGFYKISMGDIIRERANKLNIERTRENLQKIGNRYRKKYGTNYWIKEVLKKTAKSDKDRIIIDGVRTPAEARYFRKHSFLILIDAKPTIRYKRILKRTRENDKDKTIKELKEEEIREFRLLKTDKAFKYAKYKILNNKNKKAFDIVINKFIRERIN